jgi:hypothetical protein
MSAVIADQPRPFVPWGPLTPPVNPEVTGPELGVCPPLTLDQAIDVLRWAGRLPTEDAKASA